MLRQHHGRRGGGQILLVRHRQTEVARVHQGIDNLPTFAVVHRLQFVQGFAICQQQQRALAQAQRAYAGLQFEAGFVGLEQHHGARYERLLPAIAAATDDGLMTFGGRAAALQVREGCEQALACRHQRARRCALLSRPMDRTWPVRAYKLRDTLARLTRWNLVKSKRMRTMIW